MVVVAKPWPKLASPGEAGVKTCLLEMCWVTLESSGMRRKEEINNITEREGIFTCAKRPAWATEEGSGNQGGKGSPKKS